MDFTNKSYEAYHKHTYYSHAFLSADSTVGYEDYCKRAKELGQKTVSCVEHGWQGNYYELYEKCKKYGLKFIFGTEAYWVKDRKTNDPTNAHMIILAKNENGRKAINRILAEANLTGFYYRPRVDLELLKTLPKDDVVVTSACVAFWNYPDAEQIAIDLHNYFGDNFYLEVQPHNVEKQKELNRKILSLSERENIQLIAGTDSHYIYPNQAAIREEYIRTKGMNYNEDEEGWYMDVPSYEEFYNRFIEQGVLSPSQIEKAIDNTNIVLEFKEYDSPVFDTSLKMPSLLEGKTQEEKDAAFKQIIKQSWDKFKQDIPKEERHVYVGEIVKEVDTVIKTKMSDYFIDNYYIMKEGKEDGGELTRTGRGSAVSFFINNLLGFTAVDRISAPVHMYPERFMSATRILQSGTLPDIDHNEADVSIFAKAQEKVLGAGHSYPMYAFNTMKSSAAWKLYAKARNVPFDVANAVSEQIKKYELALANSDEGEEIRIEDYIQPEYKDIFEESKEYRGIISSWSIHPCSYLIYGKDIKEEIGLVKIKDNICCTMDGHWAEKCHFLKQDHLQVLVVELIDTLYKSIGEEPPTVKGLLSLCGPEDKTWKLYEKGCTVGLNQVEKPSTTRKVMNFKPQNISDLTAFIAAIRPGFASLYKKFENREKFEFGVKSLDAVIQTPESPNSYIMYQEQIMAVLNYAGIPMDECYTAIKDISKKRAENVFALKSKYEEGMRKVLTEQEHLPESKINEVTETVWKVIEDAAAYSFNASHAYCVALDSLFTAYFKAHHPLKFYEQYILLQQNKGNKNKIALAEAEADKYFNIKMKPLRFGQKNYTISADETDNCLTNSIGTLKGYSTSDGQVLYETYQILKDKENKYFIDVLKELNDRGFKQGKYENLIKIDYFSEYGNINELLKIAEMWEDFKHGEIKQIKKDSLMIKDEMSGEDVESDEYYIVSLSASDVLKNGKVGKSFVFESPERVYDCMLAIEENYKKQGISDATIQEKQEYMKEILGFCNNVTMKKEDTYKLIVEKIFPLNKKDTGKPWAYSVMAQSIGTGTSQKFLVLAKDFDKYPVKKDDLIGVESLSKDKRGNFQIKYSPLSPSDDSDYSMPRDRIQKKIDYDCECR